MSVLAISDPKLPEMTKFLQELPSRDEQWKKKLARMKARTRFKAAIRIARISTRFAKADDKSDTRSVVTSSTV